MEKLVICNKAGLEKCTNKEFCRHSKPHIYNIDCEGTICYDCRYGNREIIYNDSECISIEGIAKNIIN